MNFAINLSNPTLPRSLPSLNVSLPYPTRYKDVMDILEDLDFECIISTIVISAMEDMRQERTAQSTGIPGKEYLDELLSSSP
jgi:hypothetical protein